MALTEAVVVSRIQRRLRDASTATFATADIQISLLEALSDVAEYVPNLERATVTTLLGTRSLDIGSYSSVLLYGQHSMSFEQVEFPVDEDPRRIRNFSVEGSALYMDIDFDPAASENVRLTLRKPHILDGGTSTLSPKLEQIIIPYVAGKIAVDHAVNSIGGISIGGQRTAEQYEAWGQRTVDRAEKDLKRLRKAQMQIEYPRDR